MKYLDFKNEVQKQPVIFSRDLTLHSADKQVIRNQLERWCARKLLVKLRRGAYLLNPNDRTLNPSKNYIANQLYSPSYVSLECALNYYGLIPEKVSDVTNITTRKTLRLKNELGTFIYQHIKPVAFRGFKAVKDEAGLNFFIAEPEKALIDFCYLNLPNFQSDYDSVFRDSYRLQNVEDLNAGKVIVFAGFFNNNKLMKVAESLCKFIREEAR